VEEIGLLAPYNAQVALLRANLKETYPALEIGTVDGFQARRRPARAFDRFCFCCPFDQSA
jgi:DNA polymerase alpha-associated DNA helicase A